MESADQSSVNIYSHIVGAIFFLWLPVVVFTATVPPRLAVVTKMEVFVCTSLPFWSRSLLYPVSQVCIPLLL